jgi:hypothetical protein
VNRRWLFVLVLVFACTRREKPADQPALTGAPPSPPLQVSKPADSPVSYEGTINRFRTSPAFHFTYNDGTGSLKRPRQGMEELTLDIARGPDRGKWTASVKPNGVIWTKDGKHESDVPLSLQRLFQRLTIFPDPQKKEGVAQPTPGGFQFTDANGGDRYALETSSGKIVRITINDLSIAIRN